MVSEVFGEEMKVEVRCCCNPVKLLGHVEIPERFVGNRVCLPLKPVSPFDPYEQIWFDYAEFYIGSIYGMALKNVDRPIETLMRIPGFVPEYDESISHPNVSGSAGSGLQGAGVREGLEDR